MIEWNELGTKKKIEATDNSRRKKCINSKPINVYENYSKEVLSILVIH